MAEMGRQPASVQVVLRVDSRPLSRDRFPWSPPLAAVLACGGNLGCSARSAPFGSELARHPMFRTEHALQQRRYVEIGVEPRPVKA